MVLAVEETVVFFRLATILVPMGMYFLLLGLLNSRRTPQLLSGRQDFAMLILALAPVLLLPVLQMFQATLAGMALLAGAVLAGALVLSPRPGRWVIYNLPAEKARRIIAGALEAVGLGFSQQEGGFRLAAGGPSLQISAFPLLRNVSIRLVGADKAMQQEFADALGRGLMGCQAETCPATVGLMLVAIGMMVAPLVLVAHRVGEIVRIVVDLLP